MWLQGAKTECLSIIIISIKMNRFWLGKELFPLTFILTNSMKQNVHLTQVTKIINLQLVLHFNILSSFLKCSLLLHRAFRSSKPAFSRETQISVPFSVPSLSLDDLFWWKGFCNTSIIRVAIFTKLFCLNHTCLGIYIKRV